MSSKTAFQSKKISKSNDWDVLLPSTWIREKPDHVLLYVGKNDAMNYEETEIVDKLL